MATGGTRTLGAGTLLVGVGLLAVLAFLASHAIGGGDPGVVVVRGTDPITVDAAGSSVPVVSSTTPAAAADADALIGFWRGTYRIRSVDGPFPAPDGQPRWIEFTVTPNPACQEGYRYDLAGRMWAAPGRNKPVQACIDADASGAHFMVPYIHSEDTTPPVVLFFTFRSAAWADGTMSGTFDAVTIGLSDAATIHLTGTFELTWAESAEAANG